MKKSTIEQMQRLAKQRGGKCLSTIYINGRSKLIWQCKESHQWKAIPNSIKNGSWCPLCLGTKKHTMQEMEEIARSHGGKCLSPEYINSASKLRWQCKHGHEWKATPAHIKNGTWCPTCRRNKGSIEQMQKMAARRGGKCLSTTYLNAHAKLTWQCKEGHQWEAAPGNITRGDWCRRCSYISRILDFAENA